MPTTTQRFHDGAKVLINGLKHAKLNGTCATILSYDGEADRYRVACESGEKVRVRPQNLFQASESVQEPSTSSPASSPASSSSSRPDATIFVQGGRFVLPGVTAPVPMERLTSIISKDGTTHRIPLPPGHWEVNLLEHDPTAPLVRAHLVAIAKVQGEGDAGATNHEEWNELMKGLTCTRVIDLSEEDDAERLSAGVKESVLEVFVPTMCDGVEEVTNQDEPAAAVTAPQAAGDVLGDVTAERVNAFDGRTTEMNFDAKVPPPVQRICSAEALSRRPGRLRRMRSAGAAMPSKRSAAAGSRRRAWKAAAREMTRETIAMEA